MPGQTPQGAFDTYADPLKAVFGCITRQPLRREILKNRRNTAGIPLEHFFFANAPVRLKAADRNYALIFDQFYRVLLMPDETYRVKTQSYTYEIEDEATRHELFAFHWEPHSAIAFPHLHIGFGLRGHDLPIDNKAHIPSGRVALEDVVLFAIRELKVKSLRVDWEEIIGRARERFFEHRSW
ncbi:MAG: hypothetical protein ACRD6B_23730 [Bryobacteraceae bacterium]